MSHGTTSSTLESPPPSRPDVASVVLFLVLAIALGSMWAQFAESHGLLTNPNTAGVAAWTAQLSVGLAALVTMLLRSRESLRNVGWHWGPAGAYLAVTLATMTVVRMRLGNLAAVEGSRVCAASQTAPTGNLVPAVPYLLLPVCICRGVRVAGLSVAATVTTWREARAAPVRRVLVSMGTPAGGLWSAGRVADSNQPAAYFAVALSANGLRRRDVRIFATALRYRCFADIRARAPEHAGRDVVSLV